MFAHITGTVSFSGLTYIIIDVGGVGYRIFTTLDTIRTCTQGERATLFTHLAVRENALDLYGFPTREEVEFFELLITISGIGPKSALGIMNVAPLSVLRQGISSGDTTYLTKVSGIGKKVAEKIVVELRDKIGVYIPAEETAGGTDSGDVLDALTALGYSQKEAREALKTLDGTEHTTEEKLKKVLKEMGGA